MVGDLVSRGMISTLAPLRGAPTGPAIRARATLLAGEQARVAASALARDHRVLQGVLVPAMHRLRRYRTMHYELEPDAG